MTSDVMVSVELAAPPATAWDAVARTGRATVAGNRRPRRLRLSTADMTVEVFVPDEDAIGTAVWDGQEFRVSVHLVPRATGRSLLILTAAPMRESLHVFGDSHSRRAHRLAHTALRAFADAVAHDAERDGARPTTVRKGRHSDRAARPS
ncbi:hypothetical protein [Cellulomonas septica]|uniref:Polyketide cyclase / dehydrase and lipid transport n=1 Tax=Cellulomonas septica TaxID=285080 RepID=A0ABX1JUJ2_9CELL|nr:hypothetical protein [Cellulomonas septica]NKY37975.1 hypothetical protein [Cellulomonas septica]